MLKIFYNPLERRLRAPWRLLVVIAVGLFGISLLGLLGTVIISALLLIFGQIPFGALSNGEELAAGINATFHRLPLLAGVRSLIVAALVVLAFSLLARWLDRRSWRDYGFHLDPIWWRDLGFGLLLGLALMGGIFAVEYALGWAPVNRLFENGQPDLPFWQLMLDGLFGFVLVGVEEELFSRGYLIRNLAEGLHFPRLSGKAAVLIAYLSTSLFFGFLHANNPNATLASSLNLVLAGLFLGLGFVLTGELAIPIGLHIAWNFAQGYVFGFPVSGVDAHISLLATGQNGPALWTGGAFGPEGGLIGLLAMVTGLLLVYAWVRLTRHSAAVKGDLSQYSRPGATGGEKLAADFQHEFHG